MCCAKRLSTKPDFTDAKPPSVVVTEVSFSTPPLQLDGGSPGWVQLWWAVILMMLVIYCTHTLPCQSETLALYSACNFSNLYRCEPCSGGLGLDWKWLSEIPSVILATKIFSRVTYFHIVKINVKIQPFSSACSRVLLDKPRLLNAFHRVKSVLGHVSRPWGNLPVASIDKYIILFLI